MSLSGSWVRLGFTTPGKSSLVVMSHTWVLNHQYHQYHQDQISILSLVVKQFNGSAHH